MRSAGEHGGHDGRSNPEGPGRCPEGAVDPCWKSESLQLTCQADRNLASTPIFKPKSESILFHPQVLLQVTIGVISQSERPKGKTPLDTHPTSCAEVLPARFCLSSSELPGWAEVFAFINRFKQRKRHHAEGSPPPPQVAPTP